MEILRNMPFEALVGLVEDCPWFGAAQMALCGKMTEMGGRDLARDMYAGAALQVPERRRVVTLFRQRPTARVSEPLTSSVAASVATPIATPFETSVAAPIAHTEGGVNRNYHGAGDYFSREQYEQMKKEDEQVKEETESSGSESAETPATAASKADYFNFDRDVSLDGFCTEALAEIYAEQGYYERAKDIYSKLILAEPEKNTYFASLIEKLNEKN